MGTQTIGCPQCKIAITYTDDARCGECGARLCACLGEYHRSDCPILPMLDEAREAQLAALEREGE